MKQKTVTISNRLGLHARAAAKFVRVAAGFAAEINVQSGRRRVSGKSIMGIMMLAAGRGAEILISADGPDEAAAISALEALVNDRFGEAE